MAVSIRQQIILSSIDCRIMLQTEFNRLKEKYAKPTKSKKISTSEEEEEEEEEKDKEEAPPKAAPPKAAPLHKNNGVAGAKRVST